MKEFGSILFIFVILLTGGNQGTFSDISDVSPDSSKVNTETVMPDVSTDGSMAHQRDSNTKHKYLTVDCPLFLSDSTSSTMKTFVPDSRLTDSMPIFKPENLDTGMVAGDCYRIVPKN